MTFISLAEIRAANEAAYHSARSTGRPPEPEAAAIVPRLVGGAEAIGAFESSGLWEPPFLVRRPDGQSIAVSGLLHLVVSSIDGTRDVGQIAARVSSQQKLRLAADDVEYLLERKLAPLGLLVGASEGVLLERPDPLLGLKFRVGIIPARAVRAVGALFAPLFFPAIVALMIAGLVAFDVWLVAWHPVDRELILGLLRQPALLLALTGIAWISVAFHEIGHAAAGRYSGMMPGRMGVGLYIIWPVFYTDVTESYRLGRGGRLRIDLGGVYFNVIFAIALIGTYFATGFEPLLLAIVSQHLTILTQFLPWLRLDGYWVVSDLIGVSDLFARMRPTLLSFVPGRELHPSVGELKPWARRAVGIWVLSAMLALGAVLGALVYAVPRLVPLLWDSLQLQLDLLPFALDQGDLLAALSAAVGVAVLGMPWVAVGLTSLLILYRSARWLWRWAGFGLSPEVEHHARATFVDQGRCA